MDFDTLPLPLVQLVDRACDRFEAEWRAGGRPVIERFLDESAGPERPALLRALLAVELEMRRERGESPTREEYAARFPEWAGLVCAAFEDEGDTTVTFAPGPAGGQGPSAASGSPDDRGDAAGGPDSRRFRVLRPHAAGGLGEVFIAHDQELNREVALKAMRDRHADDPSSRRRFLLEAEVTGGWSTRGSCRSTAWASMATGGLTTPCSSSAGRRSRRPSRGTTRPTERVRPRGVGRWPCVRLLGRFVAVCNAIAYAHSRGVIHRDLKPANVMLGPYGETLVVDWGLARSTERGGADDAPARGRSTRPRPTTRP